MIDYGMGNLRSVEKAFEHCGAQVDIVTSPDFGFEADALILPGVGALGDCVNALNQTGLANTVRAWIEADKPFFGVCLGMQALFEFSEEGNVEGLGVFKGTVRRFDLPSAFKIPHMGWNRVEFVQENPISTDIPTDAQFYFVHSYYCDPEASDITLCQTNYGDKAFVSGIRSANCFATQFHPEKSQARGLQMYRNFIQWLVDKKS